MKINITTQEAVLSEREELLIEAERLLLKIAKLTTRYHSKLYKIRKRIHVLEELLGE